MIEIGLKSRDGGLKDGRVAEVLGRHLDALRENMLGFRLMIRSFFVLITEKLHRSVTIPTVSAEHRIQRNQAVNACSTQDTSRKTTFGLAVEVFIIPLSTPIVSAGEATPCSKGPHKAASYPAEEAKIYFFNTPVNVSSVFSPRRTLDWTAMQRGTWHECSRSSDDSLGISRR